MNHLISIALPLVLLAWVVYRRVQRTVGFQKLAPRRLRVRIGITSGIALLVLGVGYLHPIAYVGDAVGMLAGAGLALLAIQFLVFEQRDGTWYYRTHVWVESIVIVLFLARLGFRAWEMTRSGGGHQSVARLEDPFTSGAVLMFICYYLLFAIALLFKGRNLENTSGIQGAD